MSLYIAQKINSNNQAHAVFTFRNIKGYTQAAPSAVHIVGLPHIREPAYSGYKDNIDIFILANNTGKSVRLDSEGGLYIPKGFLPISIGPLVFSVNQSLKLTADQEDRLLGQLGNATKEKSGKVSKFTVPEIGWSTFEKISKFANMDFGTGRKELNMRGADLAFTLSSLIYEFLATNSYAAFRGDDEYDGEISYGEFVTPHSSFVKGTGFDEYGRRGYDISSVISRKKIRLMEVDEAMRSEEEKYELALWENTKKVRAVGTTSMRDSVWIAHPKRGEPASNFGPAASIPSMPGLIFPYFLGMNSPDPLTFKTSITSFFLRCLGEDLDKAKERMGELRTGATNLAGTDVGMVLAHILTGLRLCLETQSRLYVIIEADEYKGFGLMGWHFSVYDGSRWIDAETQGELKLQMHTLDTHSSNLSYICDELSAMSVIGKEDIEMVDPEKIMCGHDLIDKIRERKIECSGDEEEKMNLALRGMYFGEPYATPTFENIGLFMTAINTDTMPDRESATFLYQIKGDYSDVVYRNLLCFGPEAPVPIGQSGLEFAIPEPKKDDPIFNPKEGKPVDALVFYMKPPHVAKNDWYVLMKRRVVKMNVKERAGPHKAIFFRDPENRGKLWDLVRICAWSKKRLVEEKEMPVAKRAKVATVDDIFGLFA